MARGGLMAALTASASGQNASTGVIPGCSWISASRSERCRRWRWLRDSLGLAVRR